MRPVCKAILLVTLLVSVPLSAQAHDGTVGGEQVSYQNTHWVWWDEREPEGLAVIMTAWTQRSIEDFQNCRGGFRLKRGSRAQLRV